MDFGFINNHRGPFRMLASRPHPTKKTLFTTDWLKGEVEKVDVVEEATSVLCDPRDTILSVSVWSVREEQFVGTIRRTDVCAATTNS